MNAVSVISAKPREFELSLEASAELPRKMCIEVSVGGRFYVDLFDSSTCIALASADCRPADALLHIGQNGAYLHVESAIFRLCASEAAEIERIFALLGLPVSREESV